jgi:uncharacterized protein (DUF1330 family)
MPRLGNRLFRPSGPRNSRPAVAKNVGITEFESLDQAVAYRNSPAFKELDPLRNKAIKITRQYTVEAEN